LRCAEQEILFRRAGGKTGKGAKKSKAPDSISGDVAFGEVRNCSGKRTVRRNRVHFRQTNGGEQQSGVID